MANVLTVVGLTLNITGTVFVILSDVPIHHSLLLRLRYFVDRYYPPVASAKLGMDYLLSSTIIYKNKEDAAAEKPDDMIETREARQVLPNVVGILYRIIILRDNFPLYTEKYKQGLYIHSMYELYKIEKTDEFYSKDNQSTIEFVFKWTGPKISDRPETMTHNLPQEEFIEYFVEYTNGKYVRLGWYLLIIGFLLQVFSNLLI